jgi:anti-sigma factor RsiW
LNAHLDGELDVRDSAAIEAHLSTCSACSARLRSLRELSQSVRVHASRFAPREGFVSELSKSLSAAPAPVRRHSRLRVLTLVASCAAALALVWLAGPRLLLSPDADHRLADEVVAAHVRSLQVDHLTDVASSDRHTVSPWFQGKVPFVPGARDFTDRGYALEGGRLDYVDGRAVAALVYRHGPHALNVFVWPTEGSADTPLQTLTVRGYCTCHWAQGGMRRWIVSDADPSTVLQLVHLLSNPD